MSQVAIYRPENQPSVLVKPFFKEVAAAYEAIENRAFELFERRGRTHGLDLEDWLTAERELFLVPGAEMTETDKDFRMELDVRGFENTNINVSALPGEIVVRADYENIPYLTEDAAGEIVVKNQFESKSLYRRFEMGAFDPDKVTARVDKGVLTIVASKMAATTEAPAEKSTTAAAA